MKVDYINETVEERLEFDDIATNIFGPAYEIIVEDIIKETKKTRGICIDIGSGGGHLGISLSKKTDFKTFLFDISSAALEYGKKRIIENKLEKRVETLLGNVENIPLDNESVDLAISRGSVWFWEDQKKGFREVFRVLKKGGFAYIGGGFGNEKTAEKIDREMLKTNSNWQKKKEEIKNDSSSKRFREILKELNPKYYKIIDDKRGLWAIFSK